MWWSGVVPQAPRVQEVTIWRHKFLCGNVIVVNRTFFAHREQVFVMQQEKTQAIISEKTDGRISVPANTPRPPSKWAVLAILAIGIFMATLDTSIVNISLPTIAQYFKVPLSGAIEWVIIAYLVVIAGVLLTIGRLADMVGRRLLWVSGLVVFTLGS